jgi:hypothetical protein
VGSCSVGDNDVVMIVIVAACIAINGNSCVCYCNSDVPMSLMEGSP